jgi:hypothetical protein
LHEERKQKNQQKQKPQKMNEMLHRNDNVENSANASFVLQGAEFESFVLFCFGQHGIKNETRRSANRFERERGGRKRSRVERQ